MDRAEPFFHLASTPQRCDWSTVIVRVRTATIRLRSYFGTGRIGGGCSGCTSSSETADSLFRASPHSLSAISVLGRCTCTLPLLFAISLKRANRRTWRNCQAAVAARLLFAEGLLSKSTLHFEHRPGQYDMAKAVEAALKDKRHLIVEAGTGTGKTLAYLLPALRHARERGQRVILSTGTKNLQEQLFFKDVPFLESVLSEQYGPLKVCYMKGRANYLCKHKLYALRDSPLLSGLEEIEQFHHIATWERTTVNGRSCRAEPPARKLRAVAASWTRAPRPAWARPARTGRLASLRRCGGRRWNPT